MTNIKLFSCHAMLLLLSMVSLSTLLLINSSQQWPSLSNNVCIMSLHKTGSFFYLFCLSRWLVTTCGFWFLLADPSFFPSSQYSEACFVYFLCCHSLWFKAPRWYSVCIISAGSSQWLLFSLDYPPWIIIIFSTHVKEKEKNSTYAHKVFCTHY